MEWIVPGLLVVDIVLTLILGVRRRPIGASGSGSTDIHDHEAHDAGVLSELRQSSRILGGKVDLHDVEAVMRRRRDRRRREG